MKNVVCELCIQQKCLFRSRKTLCHKVGLGYFNTFKLNLLRDHLLSIAWRGGVSEGFSFEGGKGVSQGVRVEGRGIRCCQQNIKGTIRKLTVAPTPPSPVSQAMNNE